MNFLWHMFSRAVEDIAAGRGDLLSVTVRTLWLALLSTGIALIAGLPLGVALGTSRNRLGRIGRVIANAGLGLPPVILGVFLALALLPGSLLGMLTWTSTVWAIVLAQVLLALPIVVALTASAVASLSRGLFDQARAFGADRTARTVLALREARVAVTAAVITALGSAIAEVGAVVIVGGNIRGSTNTLSSTILLDLAAADPVAATADLIVMLLVVAVVGGILTLVQQRHRRPERTRP